jgi:hemoglobin/transferrin/lactoferrin receptor protein
VSFDNGSFKSEFSVIYNGWKKLKDYNPDGEDNGQYATKDGMPSWATLNLKVEYTVNKNLTFQGAVENMLDRNYRYFASGFSAPGRNFYFTMRTHF